MGGEVFTAGWNVVSGEVATAAKFNQLGDNDDYLKDKVDKSTPVGTIASYIGTSDPNGWLIANGRNISRSDYAELFALIGTAYGEGDGSTTFALPNLSGRMTVGLDTGDTRFDGVGKTGGAKEVALTVAQLPAHRHHLGGWMFRTSDYIDWYTGEGIGYTDNVRWGLTYNFKNKRFDVGETEYTSNTGSNTPHENMPPFFAANTIIKV